MCEKIVLFVHSPRDFFVKILPAGIKNTKGQSIPNGKRKKFGLFFYLDPTHSLKKHILQCLPIQDQISFSFFGEVFFSLFCFLARCFRKKTNIPISLHFLISAD